MALFQKGGEGGPGAPKRGRYAKGWFREMMDGCYSIAEWRKRFKSLPALEQFRLRGALEPKDVRIEEERLSVTFVLNGVRDRKPLAGEVVRKEIDVTPVKELEPAVDSSLDRKLYQPSEETLKTREDRLVRLEAAGEAADRRQRENDMLRAQTRSMNLPTVQLPTNPANDPGPKAPSFARRSGEPDLNSWASLDEDPERPEHNRAGRRLLRIDPNFLDPPVGGGDGGLKNC